VIISDIVMPGMDGFEMAEALKSSPKTKDIPIIVLSASSTVEQKEKVLNSDFFTAYLEKPLNVNHLLKELSHIIPWSRTADLSARTPGEASPGADAPYRFNELSEETLKRLPRLIKILREEMLPLTEKFKGVLKTEEVKQFALKLKQLGEEFAVPGLIDYAHRLDEFEREFDIEGIEKSLADFPAMLEKLILQLEDYNEYK
jgi:response regulator RpfG family c-di-GMP phosphodiesterase